MACVHESKEVDDVGIPKETPSPSPVPNWDQTPDAPTMTYNWVDVTEDFKSACQGSLCNFFKCVLFFFICFRYYIAIKHWQKIIALIYAHGD